MCWDPPSGLTDRLLSWTITGSALTVFLSSDPQTRAGAGSLLTTPCQRGLASALYCPPCSFRPLLKTKAERERAKSTNLNSSSLGIAKVIKFAMILKKLEGAVRPQDGSQTLSEVWCSLTTADAIHPRTGGFYLLPFNGTQCQHARFNQGLLRYVVPISVSLLACLCLNCQGPPLHPFAWCMIYGAHRGKGWGEMSLQQVASRFFLSTTGHASKSAHSSQTQTFSFLFRTMCTLMGCNWLNSYWKGLESHDQRSHMTRTVTLLC